MHDQTELFRRAAKGDETAFSALVKQTEATVYRTLFSITQNREDALDLAQETYLKLWRTLPTFRGDCAPITWILRIAKNCAIDHIRKLGKESVLPLTFIGADGEEQTLDIPDRSADANPKDAFARKQTQMAVRQAILSLGEEQQTVLVLREFEGLSYEEIAHRLSLEVGTVKSRLSRARQAVKEFLVARNLL